LGRFQSFVFGLLVTLSPLAAHGAAGDNYERAISHALTLLPRRPARIVVLDASQASSEVRKKIRNVQAFVTAGDSAIYLVKQGTVLQEAVQGSGVYDYMLAAIIWHEMAHLEGADEQNAQLKEEQLWMEYVRQGQVAAETGLRYAGLMRKRHEMRASNGAPQP